MPFAIQNSNAQKKSKMISVGTIISRMSEKPFNYSNGQKPGIKPMFEYQVEKNIFGGYYYSYGIGFKVLGERRYKTFENFKHHEIKVIYLDETPGSWQAELDTVFTYIGDLTNKHRIKLSYVYFPVGITYYAGEKLSFGMEYSLAYVWGGKFNLNTMFSDVTNNYTYDYSANVDLPGSKRTDDRYVYRWDHWLRFSARYKYKDFLFRVGFEKGLRNIFSGKDIPMSYNGKTMSLPSRYFDWKNTSLFLSIGIKLTN